MKKVICCDCKETFIIDRNSIHCLGCKSWFCFKCVSAFNGEIGLGSGIIPYKNGLRGESIYNGGIYCEYCD